MASSLDKALRRFKPHKIAKPYSPNPNSLLRAGDQHDAGRALLLDTTVYVDILKGNIPTEAERLLQTRQVQHSTVCVAELVNLFGRLDPSHPNTASVLGAIRKTLERIPSHRTFNPTGQAWLAAGIMCGSMIRQLGAPGATPNRYLNDALLFAQADAMGLHILSRNSRDFDALNKIAKRRIVIAY